ncbi:MAG: hypothetical protein ACE3JK_01520 [Sporolactobacillus sp.]
MSDYKTTFAAAVDDVVMKTKKGVAPYDQSATSAQAIEQLCEDYVLERIEENEARAAAGRRAYVVKPDTYELDRLADVVLNEVLTNKHPDKMNREEYPILSRFQDERRKFGGARNKQGVRRHEVPLIAAAQVGIDGVDYGESARVLAERKGDNRERNDAYHAFIAEQPVTTYKLV